jgi:two-component system, LuxR family, response regulator FixJ
METHHELAGHVAVVGIVDDDPAVRNSLKFSLEIDGFVVRTYGNADALLNEAELSQFSCLVVDQNMPGTSGLDLVAKLRQRGVFVPVILITSHPPRVLIARANKAGVPIVEKPLLGNALLEKIRDVAGPNTRPIAS